MKNVYTISHFLVPPSTEVSHFTAQDNQLIECNGVNASYKLGELRKDTGYLRVGVQIHANQPITSVYPFMQSAAIKKDLAITNDATGANSELWYSTGGNYTQITTTAWNSLPNMRVEFETFINYAFMVGYNGSSFLPSSTLTDTTFSTTTNTRGMAQGKYIKRYRDRVYVANSLVNILTTLSGDVLAGATSIAVADSTHLPDAGTISFGANTGVTYTTNDLAGNLGGIPATGPGSIGLGASSGATVELGSSTPTPFRVYFSEVPVGGTLSWMPSTGFFDVDFSEEITGISSNWDRLMVFTLDNAYMYDQLTLKKVFATGCVNHRTIQNIEAYMIWLGPLNVYISTSGGRPQPIGNDILELIRNSDQINVTPDSNKLCSGVANNEYNLYLGATSANGISYTNCMATYNFDRGMWRWRELADEPRSMAFSRQFTPNPLTFGGASGRVFRKGDYSGSIWSDDGADIKSRFRTRAFDLGSPEALKVVNRVIAYSRTAGGLQLRFRVFDKGQEANMPFTDLGTMKSAINIFDKRLDGHFIQFEGVEYGKNEPWAFNGFSMVVGPSSHQAKTAPYPTPLTS